MRKLNARKVLLWGDQNQHQDRNLSQLPTDTMLRLPDGEGRGQVIEAESTRPRRIGSEGMETNCDGLYIHGWLDVFSPVYFARRSSRDVFCHYIDSGAVIFCKTVFNHLAYPKQPQCVMHQISLMWLSLMLLAQLVSSPPLFIPECGPSRR